MKLEDMLLQLKQEYVASLPQRVETLRAQFASGNVVVLKDEFHRLKGSGKTYGLPEVSSVGEVGEKICRDKQTQVSYAVPVLIDLLSEIHQKQSRQESFDVGRDPRFSQLKQLI